MNTDLIRSASHGSLNLIQQVHRVVDLSVELLEVIEVALDLLEREINQHACDLGSSALTHESLDILVDELTN